MTRHYIAADRNFPRETCEPYSLIPSKRCIKRLQPSLRAVHNPISAEPEESISDIWRLLYQERQTLAWPLIVKTLHI